MREQQIRMEVLLKEKLLATLGFPQVRVNDGEWHHLLVEIRSIKEGKEIKYMAAVSLDYGMYKVKTFTSSVDWEVKMLLEEEVLIFVCVFF